MKGQKVKLGVAIALSSTVAMQSCNGQDKSDSSGDIAKEQAGSQIVTDSVRLEKRLLELSKTKYDGELSMGAMCYDPAKPELVDYACSICGTIEKERYDSWTTYFIGDVQEMVKEIQDLGYDAQLDPTEFCTQCSKQTIERPELLFKIRFSEKGDYYSVKSNITSDYQCLLTFLSSKDKYNGEAGEENALHDNIQTIQKMTGLGKAIKQVK